MWYLKGKSLPRHSIKHLRLSVIILEPLRSSQTIRKRHMAFHLHNPAWSHFWGSDPKIMAELRIWFLRTNAGIDHIRHLKTLERCYFVQAILSSPLLIRTHNASVIDLRLSKAIQVLNCDPNPDLCYKVCTIWGKDGQDLKFPTLGAPKDTI